MAIFTASQKLSQDIKGEYLVLIDTSNYDDNTSGLSVSDFVDRKWGLEDIDGVITQVPWGYVIDEENSVSVEIDKDKYLKITLTITTAGGEIYTAVNETGLTRRASYKKKLLLDKDPLCCSVKNMDKLINDANQLIESAIIDIKSYNNTDFNIKITAANKILSSLLKV